MKPILGVFVGNVFDILVSSIVSLIILTLTYAVATGGDPDVDRRAALESIAHSGQFLILTFISGSMVSTLAGYVAAWIAGRTELTCGLLSSLACVAGSVFGLLGGAHARLPIWVEVSALFLSPALGRLGGQLRKAAVERRARSRSLAGPSAA